MARQSLEEVREAVGGYRRQSLAAELDHAYSALSSAGIDAHVHRSPDALPADVETLLGWAVREGVTNVLRHSQARHCQITVRRVGQEAGGCPHRC